MVEFEGVRRCLGGSGVGMRDDENVDGEWAPEGDCVAVGISVCPNSCHALHYRVVLREQSFSCAVQRESHGLYAGLRGD